MEPTADNLAAAYTEDASSRALYEALSVANGYDNNHLSPDRPLDLRQMLNALQAVRVGDFSVRLAADQDGISGKIADAFNEIVAANQRMAQQLEYVGQVVRREGRRPQRVTFP